MYVVAIYSSVMDQVFFFIHILPFENNIMMLVSRKKIDNYLMGIM